MHVPNSLDGVGAGWVAMGIRFLPQTMGKQGGKTLRCIHLSPEWSSTWERVKMSLWPCYTCGQNVYPRHVPAGGLQIARFSADGELAVACTTFCLLERHGHTAGTEDWSKCPPFRKRVYPFAGVQL